MPTIDELTEPFIEHLVPVPPSAPGVCDVCHGAPNPGFSTCWSCDSTVAGVWQPVRRVVPVSLCTKDGQLYHVLKSYKGWTEHRFLPLVAAIIGRFLRHHQRCLLADEPEFDAIEVVPSTRRAGEHPLARAIQMLRPMGALYQPLLGKGPGDCGHNQPNEDAFRVTRDVRGRVVLLVDDTYTTGARAQSAASALQLAGARVPSVMVVGRIINPGFSDFSRDLWERAAGDAFDFARCCLC